MGRFVIVAYKPKAGMELALNALVGKHLRVLAHERLVTERSAYVMRGKDGTLLEVFEWRSVEAIASAHVNPAVMTLWAEFAAVCDYVPLATLAEAQLMFAEFEPVSL